MSKIIDNIEIYDESEGLIVKGKATTSVIPTTANRFIKGCEILGVNGVNYQNVGTVASPSWVDEDSVISGDLSVSGNTVLTGNLNANGNTVIGNSSSDTITFTAKQAGTLYRNETGSSVMSLKQHNHDTTATIGTMEGKTESTATSGAFTGIWNEAHTNADGTGSVTADLNAAVVVTGKTNTGGTIIGSYGQARADGTVAGSGFMAGVYGLIEEGGGAITASHVTSAWLDSHRNTAVTGNHELLYMSNNGTASLDSVMYASGQAEALIHLNTAGGPALNYISDTAETAGAAKKIKILVEGVPYYINIYPGA